MAPYRPPDSVLVAIGAAYPGAALLTAGARLVARARDERAVVAPFGLGEAEVAAMEEDLASLRRMLSSPRAQKHDRPLQMQDLSALLARARGWLATLRMVASIDLGGDAPAIRRLASVAPELVEGYPRDLVEELEQRLAAALDLAPRLVDAGVGRAFLTAGQTIAARLRTAIGPRDLRPEDLDLELRRLYLRKGTLYVALKRWTRIGKLAFHADPLRAEGWDLAELEPIVRVPLSG